MTTDNVRVGGCHLRFYQICSNLQCLYSVGFQFYCWILSWQIYPVQNVIATLNHSTCSNLFIVNVLEVIEHGIEVSLYNICILTVTHDLFSTPIHQKSTLK